MSAPRPAARRRLWFTVAAVAAAAVATVFGTVGDGVEVAGVEGARAAVIDLGHTAVWVLLAAAFALAAVRGRWGRVSNAVALAGGAIYVVFLVAVFLWR